MGVYAQAERAHKRRPAAPEEAARSLSARAPDETGPADRPTLGETLNDSPRVAAQLRIGRTLNEGPRAAAQARLAETLAARRPASASEAVTQRRTGAEDDAAPEREADVSREPSSGVGRVSSPTRAASSGEPPVQGVFLYYLNGAFYEQNPAPHLAWMLAPFPPAPPHYQPFYAYVPAPPPTPYAYQPPVYASAPNTSAPRPATRTPAYTGPSNSNFSAPSTGTRATSSSYPTPPTGGGVSAPLKTTEEASIAPPPVTRPAVRRGVLRQKADGWYVEPSGLLKEEPIKVEDEGLLPASARDGNEVRFKAEVGGGKLLEIIDPDARGGEQMPSKGMLQGAGRMVPVYSIIPPQTRRIIFQAGYMSGDRYGMAAALNLYDDLGVLVISDPAEGSKATELLSFYEGAVPDPQKIGTCVCGDAQVAYRILNDVSEGRERLQAIGGFGGELLPLGTGTRLVAEAFAKDEEGSRETIKRGWFAKEGVAEQNVLIREWLVGKIGMRPGKYALLWAKTGKPTDEKSYHYTDPAAWERLLRQVEERTGRAPVLIGESLPGVETEPSLVKFWERGYPGKSRIDQQRLFNFFADARHGYDVVNVGMKSGATEGPALMGLPTIYLEEAHNVQAGRMEQWLTAMPNFMRVILDAPPGDMQKDALAKIYTGEFPKQAEGRLREEIGEGAAGFSNFMREKARVLLSRMREPGLNPSELEAVLRLLATDPKEWGKLKEVKFSGGASPEERYARRNPGWEEVYKETSA